LGAPSEKLAGIYLHKRIGQKIKKSEKLYTFYAQNKDRIELAKKAYLAIVEGESEVATDNPIKAIKDSYSKEMFDEEFFPTVVTENGKPVAKIEESDGIVFFNFRPDRARQLTKAIILPGFEKIRRPRKLNSVFFVSMTEYEKDLPVSKIAFPPEKISNPLAEIISNKGFKQVHVAETEKYPHVTFFFNGGKENALPGEERVLIPSPHIASYDQKPEMSCREIKERVIQEILSEKHKLIVANFANADMVGHTGNLKATVKAVEVIDYCLKDIIEAVLNKNGTAIITADHGNAEEVMNAQTGEMVKEHSNNPVPFVLVGKQWEGQSVLSTPDLSSLRPFGILADVAPTILNILGIEKPSNMTGRSLI